MEVDMSPPKEQATDEELPSVDFLKRCYEKGPSMIGRNVDKEVILVPIRKDVGDLESIFTLNETGARIWELIDGQRSVAQIKRALLEEFDATPEEAEADIADFTAQLESIGAIVRSSC
jgi:hypothetical protein